MQRTWPVPTKTKTAPKQPAITGKAGKRKPPAGNLPRANSVKGRSNQTRILDATERLVLDEGHAAVSTRRVAKEAGLSGIIVHGLCTMSMTMRAIIESYLDSDPSKLKSLGVRFTAPVYPGDTIVVDGWEKGRENGHVVIGFDVTRKSDNVKVIKGGTAEVEI